METIHFKNFVQQNPHDVDSELVDLLEARIKNTRIPGVIGFFKENGLIHQSLLKATLQDVIPLLKNDYQVNPDMSDSMAVVISMFPEQKERLLKAHKGNLHEFFWDNEYDIDLIISLQKIPGINGETDVIQQLDAGHTEYELRTFGPYVTKVYTAKELAQVTVNKASFKSISALFKKNFNNYRRSHSSNDTPTIETIEDIVNAGFQNAGQYKEYAALFDVVPIDMENIDFLVERRKLLDFEQTKRLMDIQGNIPTLNDFKQVADIIADGNIMEDYRTVYNLTNQAAEKRFAEYNAPSSAIARILKQQKSIEDIRSEVNQGKALGEIC